MWRRKTTIEWIYHEIYSDSDSNLSGFKGQASKTTSQLLFSDARYQNSSLKMSPVYYETPCSLKDTDPPVKWHYINVKRINPAVAGVFRHPPRGGGVVDNSRINSRSETGEATNESSWQDASDDMLQFEFWGHGPGQGQDTSLK